MKSQSDSNITYKEEVLFNTDILSKIISYLPSIDVLNLALTSSRFGISNNNDSIIEESTRIAIKDIATEEQLAALPYYNGENSLANYHYLQLMKKPLFFDQLGVGAEYVNSGDKLCAKHNGLSWNWGTAFSNNVLMAGKHYVSFEVHSLGSSYGETLLVGVMRPGQANSRACAGYPFSKKFYKNFSQRFDNGAHNNNNIQCCMYNSYDGSCGTSGWEDSDVRLSETWEGMESMSMFSGDEFLGMLLDLDEGTLSVYINGRKLGVMKRGLAGPYCWVVSLYGGAQVTIRRGKIPRG